MKQSNGYVVVITGDGKGKTTSAIGMAVRAAGRGLNVLIVQFLKNAEYGEHQVLKEIKNITVRVCGRGFCKMCGDTLPFAEHKAAACEALAYVQKQMNKYDMIILDEVNCALLAKLLRVKDVVALIEKKPKKVHLVLTGRGAPKSVIRKADLVSEIAEIKHPFQKGFLARKGIEF